MSAFSEAALEKKLSELSNSQQSVQTLSLWLIHHRKHSRPIVTVWERELRKAKPNRKLTFLYLANDVIQNSKRKGPEFTKDFAPVIVEAFKHVSSETDESCKKHLGRVLSIWEERSVYENDVLEQLKQALCKYIIFYYDLFIKMYSFTLAVVSQWIESQPANQRVATSIPSQSTCLGCVPGPWWWAHKRQPQIAVSLPLFHPPFPSLKINK
ncbi:regulation of nuclear pre-mRNA domain containing 1A [Phyllostomus discolor]|uniref:Regulation of nuclear pre-mRNA domain-containing protein 1A n=1 Tax=Phyllostomus discolor TaxID=89673 RepID=A0A833Z351_9CHIR|nr:regulation of nuclear pre-mRNA domain containing 1A [Phyllostomus discolor]